MEEKSERQKLSVVDYLGRLKATDMFLKTLM